MKAKNNWIKGVKTAYNNSSRPTYYVTTQDTKEVNMCLNCEVNPEKCNGECNIVKAYKTSRRNK